MSISVYLKFNSPFRMRLQRQQKALVRNAALNSHVDQSQHQNLHVILRIAAVALDYVPTSGAFLHVSCDFSYSGSQIFTTLGSFVLQRKCSRDTVTSAMDLLSRVITD